jgi:type II secretory pathway predicted ATPase ExeA
MYHAHFGLERGLFGEGIAADAAVFRTPKHDRLIAHFKLALASTSSVVVLRGPAGVGKTTLTATALRMTSTRLALAWLDGTATNAAELLELILVELGVSTLRTSRIERVQLWKQFQSEMRATDSRLFLVVERAEDLSPEVLHALDQLTAPDATGNPGASLVLLGNEGLDAHLAAPILESLRQRIRLRAELEAFTEPELQDYLRHQAACAGGTYDRVFAPGTVAALFRYSRGVARLANSLCESALDVAAVQKHKQLTAELVAKTAVTLLGLADGAPAARPAAPAASVPSAPIIGVVAAPAEARPTPPPPAGAALPPAAPARPGAPAAAAPAVPVPPPAAPTRPEAPAAVAPAPPPPAVAAMPAKPIATAVVSPPAAPRTAPAAAEPKPVEAEFDGGATDVTDVALADFPILTDAVEFPAALPAVKPAPAAAKASAPAPPAAAAPATALPAAAATTAPAVAPMTVGTPKAAGRIETAYTGVRPPKPEPTTAPPPPDAADDDDLLRQTQTMRAISVAKSIDDISSSMAETLFGDAELDLVAAALASAAADWSDDDDEKPPEEPAAEPKAKAPPPVDDPFDLFGLGEDAPLELIDDSMQPPGKSAAR